MAYVPSWKGSERVALCFDFGLVVLERWERASATSARERGESSNSCNFTFWGAHGLGLTPFNACHKAQVALLSTFVIWHDCPYKACALYPFSWPLTMLPCHINFLGLISSQWPSTMYEEPMPHGHALPYVYIHFLVPLGRGIPMELGLESSYFPCLWPSIDSAYFLCYLLTDLRLPVLTTMYIIYAWLHKPNCTMIFKRDKKSLASPNQTNNYDSEPAIKTKILPATNSN